MADKDKYRKLVRRAFRFSDCVLQAVIFGEPFFNTITGDWEYRDKVGVRDGVVLESNCLLGDGTAAIQFPVALASTSFTYFDGVTDQTGTTDISAQWIIPNTVKVGNIRFETVAPYANWFLCDEADGFDLFNRVEGGDNASLINASAANWTTDNRFTSFQNEVGYSEGTGDQLIPAQVDADGNLTGKDALGNSLQYSGKVRINPKIVNNYVLRCDDSTQLQFSNLSGWSIVSYEANFIPIINGNNVDLNFGYIQELILNDGNINHLYTFSSEGDILYDKSLANKQNAVIVNGIWEQKTDYPKIPFSTDALFILDGTIDGNEFIDISGNGRNFIINNKDFDEDWSIGFPYKSAATISAPVGDTALIAADVNEFLYTSGVPNEISVVSLFQNIDYENKLFTRHVEQSLTTIQVETEVHGVYEDVEVELKQPYVKDIVFYNTVKSGVDLMKCNSYYSVPELDLSYKWVSLTGSDSNDGSRENPYLTINKAHGLGQDCYVITGDYDQAFYLWIKTSGKVKGIGRCRIFTSGTARVLAGSAGGNTLVEGLVLDGTNNTTNCIWISDTVSIAFNKVFCINSTGGSIAHNSSTNSDTTLIRNSIVVDNSISLYSIQSGMNSIYDSCKLYITKRFDCISDDRDLLIKHSDIEIDNNNGDTFLFNRNSNFKLVDNDLYSTTTNRAFNCGDGVSDEKILDFTYNRMESTVKGIALIDCKPGFSSFRLRNNIISDSEIIDRGTDVFVVNNIFNQLVDCSPLYVYNNSTVDIHNNRINIYQNISYGIRLGNESTTVEDNTISGKVYNNAIYHYKDIPAVTHGIFLGFNNSVEIYRNRLSRVPLAIVIKGSNTDVTNSPITYNIISESNAYGIHFKGAKNGIVYGNTLVDNFRDFYCIRNTGGDPATGIKIKNNILSGATDYTYYFDADSYSGHEIDYNILWGFAKLAFSGISDLNYSQWVNDGYDQNSQNSNPLLADFIPQGNSPAIGNGVNLGLLHIEGVDSTTYWGDENMTPNVIVSNQPSDWNIGVYVNNNGSPIIPERNLLVAILDDSFATIRINNLLDGFDLWQDDVTPTNYLRVPFDVNGNSIKTSGDTITGFTWVSRNPAGAWHNGAESELLWPACNTTAEIDATLSSNFLTSDGVTPIPKSYEDFEAQGGNVYGDNQIFYNLDFLRDIVCFKKDARTEYPDCFTKTLLRIDKNQQVFTSEGLPAMDKNGVSLYVLK